MVDASADQSEQQRLSELERLAILDTLPEQAYDDIVQLAAHICEVPIALMSLVDSERQWFKSKLGLEVNETPRIHAFCAHAIERPDLFVIPDAATDERFASNPLVTGDPNIRFYAGAPLTSFDGSPLGTLCVIDTKPREITASQRASLEVLARQVGAHLELRARNLEFERVAAERDAQTEALRGTELRQNLVIAASQAGTWDWNVRDKTVVFSDYWKALFGFEPHELSDHESEWSDRIHPDDFDAVMAWAAEGLKQAGKPFHMDYRMMHRDGTALSMSVRAVAVHDDTGQAVRAVGTVLDITARKMAEAAAEESHSRMQKILNQIISLNGIMNLDGTLVHANETALEMIGFSKEQAVNRHVADTYWFSHSQDLMRQMRAAAATAAAGEAVRFDCLLRVDDITFRTIDFSIRPVFDSNGDVEFLVPSAVDITERKAAEEALYEAKEHAEITLASIGDGVITTDNQGLIQSVNPSAETLLGLSSRGTLGRPITAVFKIVNEDTRDLVDNPLEVCLRSGKTVGLATHTILIRPDESEIAIDDSAAPIKTVEGETVGAVLIFRDVSEQRRLAARVSRQASFDALTDLPNRIEFEHRLEQLLKDSSNQKTTHALCYIDLDQFKVINDTSGHAAGDALLTQLTGVLKTKIRGRDTLARLGGDEFGLLLGDCPIDRATIIANDIKDTVREFRFDWNGRIFSVGASIGITPISNGEGDVASLLSIADSACYAAKEKGRNQIQVFEQDDRELSDFQGQMHWVNRLKDAIANDQLVLYCQEIVALSHLHGEPRRCEALLRLVDSDGRMHEPGTFLPAAERYGEIASIDRWVFEKVCSLLQNEAHDDDLVVNVNISGSSLGNSDFLEYVQNRLASSRIDASRVCFEITETAAISNLHAAQMFISTLKSSGCQFSLDDFGNGLSSFNYLKNLNVDQVKIDGDFVRDMLSDRIDHAMVEAIHKVAALMEIETVAEHVEDSATLEALRALGVNYAQGFVLSKPVPFEQFELKKRFE